MLQTGEFWPMSAPQKETPALGWGIRVPLEGLGGDISKRLCRWQMTHVQIYLFCHITGICQAH